MDPKRKTYKSTFTEPLYGTVAKNPNLYATYIASQSPDGVGEDELASVPAAPKEEAGWTGFHQFEDGKPFLFDYLLKGFFKEACSMMSKVPDSVSGKIKAFRKCIDGLVFVYPRRIPLIVNGQIKVEERPIRVQTPQGERVALVRSDTAPIGSSITFEVAILGGVSWTAVEEWLDYGQFKGLGQWRNASNGRFIWEEVKASKK